MESENKEIINASVKRQPQEVMPEERVEEKKSKSWWGWLLAGAFLFFGKLKFIIMPIFTLLKVSKFLGTGLSMGAMVVSYALFYGWKYAVGIVLLIFIHEMGHMYFARLKGLDVSTPVFIPFVGAFIRMKEEPKDAKTEAFVAIGGPLFGVIGAIGCLVLAFGLQSDLLAALAYFGFFITVFNLIPAHPLDGGRISAALSPALWIAGIIVMLLFVFYYFNPIAIIILILGVGKAWSLWKKRHEYNAYYDVEPSFRWKMGLTYFLLFGVSSFFVYILHQVQH